MAPANKPESYGPSDYSEILKEGETLGVLVGGMAVNVWANHYLERIPELNEYKPFHSRDVDFFGRKANARLVHRRIGWTIKVFRRAKAGSPVSAILTSEDGRFVEILHSVIGLKSEELERLATRLEYGEHSLIILSPPGLIRAKIANLTHINQEKSNRQDLKQTEMLIPITREFLADAIQASHEKNLRARTVISNLQFVYNTISHRTAEPYRNLFGRKGRLIFPIRHLEASHFSSFRNFLRHRIAG